VGIYLQTVSWWRGTCTVCRQSFHKHGTYPRKTPLLGVPFRIQRVICPGCGITHALIPCFVFPYSRVMAHVKEFALRGICFEAHTIEQLAEICGVEPSTINTWWQRFKAASNSLLKWLAGELSSCESPTTWLSGSYANARLRGQKLFSLFGLYRSTYHPEFFHDDFHLLCLLSPLCFVKFTGKNFCRTNCRAHL